MVFTFQRGLPIQTTRTPISMKMAQMSQVQELFHEAAQQVSLGGGGSVRHLLRPVSKGSVDRKLNYSALLYSDHLRSLFRYYSLIEEIL